jgi:hypothetical protein
LARAAREVVVAAQLVEHGAADALGGEGLELHALGRIEARQRIREANHADLIRSSISTLAGSLAIIWWASRRTSPLYCFSVVQVQLAFGGTWQLRKS